MILTSKLCVHDDRQKAANEERAGRETTLPSTTLSLSVLWPSDIARQKEIRNNNNVKSSEPVLMNSSQSFFDT
jgi:hypothetical protein